MLFAPIYIAMTFIKTWRIRSFRARLLEFLNGNTSVAFCKVPENAAGQAESPTLSSKLCTSPKSAYLCDLLDYTNTTRICSMKPHQSIELTNWISCNGGLPFGCKEVEFDSELDLDLLLECEMEQHEHSERSTYNLESIGMPVAWKAGSHLAVVVKSNIELLSIAGFNFVGGEFLIDHRLPVVRIQTVLVSGEPNKGTDVAMRGLRSEIQHSLKQPLNQFQWPVHASLLRKLSKVVDIKTDRNGSIEMNGNGNMLELTQPKRKSVTMTDVSVNTSKSLTSNESPTEVIIKEVELPIVESIEKKIVVPTKAVLPKEVANLNKEEDKSIVLENVTVEIQHNITPKKSTLKLDLKKGTSQLSASLLNISSQIKSVTTHKRVISTTAAKKTVSDCESDKESSSTQSAPKCIRSRPLLNTKSPNVIIYSDSIAAKTNLEASLRKVLDCNRYTVYSVTEDALCAGAWRGRCTLVAVAGSAGRAGPLLLAHLLDGGRLLAICSDLLHTVLPYYKTAEVRENEVVQFTYDKWKSVKMKHHIFCYQASPAKKQFSTENDRQPSKYTGHPGHELEIKILASEETWKTPSLLEATDTVNTGVAIFSQIHLEADPSDYLTEDCERSNEARLEILQKILGELLGLHVKDPKEINRVEYTRGFFLGNHVEKLSLINKWYESGKRDSDKRIMRLGNVEVEWVMLGETGSRTPSANFIPFHVYECPDDFNTVEYFENLTSKVVGRLLLYCSVMSSTQELCGGGEVRHGAGAVASIQTKGRGRGGNQWISPRGQAIISLQLWMTASESLSLIQHAAALAAVLAVTTIPGYEQLDVRLKWPNDIYFGREVKIGGNLTTANCFQDNVVMCLGTAMNISNKTPTTCVNDIILDYNRIHKTALAPISIEKFLARYCNEVEKLVDMIMDGELEQYFELYYKYWLHDNEKIRIQSASSGKQIEGTITGVDKSGWLEVRTEDGLVTVAPDGNTFDIMAGLIVPKL